MSGLTVPITVAGGSNRVMFLLLTTEEALNSTAINAVSVARGAQTFIRLGGAASQVVTGGKQNTTDIFYLFNPAQGAGDVTVSLTATGAVADRLSAAAVVLNGARQDASGLAVAGTTNGGATSISAAISPVTAGSWVLTAGVHSQSGGTLTPSTTGSTHTEYTGFENTVEMTNSFGHVDNLPTAGSITLGWDRSALQSATQRMALSMVSVAPVPEPAAVLAVAGLGLAGWRRWRIAAAG